MNAPPMAPLTPSTTASDTMAVGPERKEGEAKLGSLALVVAGSVTGQRRQRSQARAAAVSPQSVCQPGAGVGLYSLRHEQQANAESCSGAHLRNERHKWCERASAGHAALRTGPHVCKRGTIRPQRQPTPLVRPSSRPACCARRHLSLSLLPSCARSVSACDCPGPSAAYSSLSRPSRPFTFKRF